MITSTLFHRFFYNPEENGRLEHNSYSFEGNAFYSYHTVIGLNVVGKDGNPVLLISDYNMTPTTSKHLSQLRAACPYPPDHVIRVPFQFGDYSVKAPAAVAERFEDWFTRFDARSLSYTVNRNAVIRKSSNLQQFNNLVFTVKKPLLEKAGELAKLAGLGNDRKALNEAISGIAAKREAAAKKQHATEMRRLKKILEPFTELSYLDRVKIAYATSGVEADVKKALRVQLNATTPELSFVYLHGDYVRTTQDISIPISRVKALLKRWKAKNLPIGSHIEQYTLQENSKGFIKIGCHRIPRENITALAEALQV